MGKDERVGDGGSRSEPIPYFYGIAGKQYFQGEDAIWSSIGNMLIDRIRNKAADEL